MIWGAIGRGKALLGDKFQGKRGRLNPVPKHKAFTKSEKIITLPGLGKDASDPAIFLAKDKMAC